MKKLSFLLLLVTMLLFFTSVSSEAGLEVIGTARYLESNYNLIYENDQHLVWLDYTRSADNWQNQVSWASGLGANLTVTLNPGYTTAIDWTTGWRLPSAGDNPQVGYGQTNPEMGHLYYESLIKPAGGPLGDTSPFNNLQAYVYWSGTEFSFVPSNAWYLYFGDGNQNLVGKYILYYGLAVRPGDVSAPVPIPAAIWLLGSGMVGLAGIRRKLTK